MQRRPGKALAHIAPPIQSPSSSSSSEIEKVSVLNQRLFGVTNRIWIIISVFLFLISFTHFVLPKNHPVHYEAYSTANLKPKNYINSSDTEPNPFAFCPLFGPGDDIGAKYGSLTLSQSRLHLGSGARIQRVIHRALLGHPITISVVGGSGEYIYLFHGYLSDNLAFSVSACHGAGEDPISPECYPSRVFRWWNSVFPHPVSELTNGAVRRTNSAYFGYCSAHHIPDVTDLVIIELDVDDTPFVLLNQSSFRRFLTCV
jgi:hypothetical protein